MTIEIRRPELEALIRERMEVGGFQNVEDVLLQALKSTAQMAERGAGFSEEMPAATGADLVSVMQASPYKEIDLDPQRRRAPVRDVVF
jgi:hypothetical protein